MIIWYLEIVREHAVKVRICCLLIESKFFTKCYYRGVSCRSKDDISTVGVRTTNEKEMRLSEVKVIYN